MNNLSYKEKSIKCSNCENTVRMFCKEHSHCINCYHKLKCCNKFNFIYLKDDKTDDFVIGNIYETPDGLGKFITYSYDRKNHYNRRKILVFSLLESSKIRRFTRTKIIDLQKN